MRAGNTGDDGKPAKQESTRFGGNLKAVDQGGGFSVLHVGSDPQDARNIKAGGMQNDIAQPGQQASRLCPSFRERTVQRCCLQPVFDPGNGRQGAVAAQRVLG
jgi:hypothetical protein